MNEVYTGDCWIVAVDGRPTDVRTDSGLATRQGKVRKASNPQADVTLHYGSASRRTFHDGKALVVEITATLSDHTLIARVLQDDTIVAEMESRKRYHGGVQRIIRKAHAARLACRATIATRLPWRNG